MLSQDWVRFLLVGPELRPVLAVAADEPPDAADREISSGALDAAELTGWTITPRLTFVLVTAPDDEGFSVLCSDPEQVDAVGRWLNAVERSTGSWLVFVPIDRFTDLAESTGPIDTIEGHGGFVPLDMASD